MGELSEFTKLTDALGTWSLEAAEGVSLARIEDLFTSSLTLDKREGGGWG